MKMCSSEQLPVKPNINTIYSYRSQGDDYHFTAPDL